VLQIAVEELKGRVPVRAMGVEPHGLDEMLRFVRRAEHYKVDAVHIFSPEMGHGARPNAAELEAYFSIAIPSTSLPVILSSYDAMGFVLPVKVIEKLADRFGNLVGFFYGGSDLAYLTDVTMRLGDRIEVHCAGPYNALTTMGLGGKGFMGHEGNLSPALVASVAAAFRAGDTAKLVEAYRKLMAVHVLHKAHGGAAGRAMKPLLKALGLPGGELRPPRKPIGGEDLKAIVKATLALKLPGLPTKAAA
jgi:4-hydroxy-tetrahydrodipicolinate synthase